MTNRDKIIYSLLKEYAKQGELIPLLQQCCTVDFDMQELKQRRYRKDYIANFFQVECEIDTLQELYDTAQEILKYIDKMPDKKYSKLFKYKRR